jgi:hypothetical protein
MLGNLKYSKYGADNGPVINENKEFADTNVPSP